jgi:hypothetical protein
MRLIQLHLLLLLFPHSLLTDVLRLAQRLLLIPFSQ